MSRGDAIRALNHPYRRSILRVLQTERMTYSDLFSRLEPNGGERARFNYHLRSLRDADLVWLTDGLYRLTPRGKAALVLLRGVSESGARPRPRQEIRADERGWGRRVGDALPSLRGYLMGPLRVSGVGAVIAGMITIGLALYFFGGASFGHGGSFEPLFIGVPIAAAGLVLLGLGGALRFVAALLLGVGILGIALEVANNLVYGTGYLSSPVGYLMNWGTVWGVPSLALGLGLLAVSFFPRPTIVTARPL